MKVKDIIIGFIVLVAIVAGIVYFKNYRKNKTAVVPVPTPNFQQIESKFPGLKVPENADRASLSGVAGAQGIGEAFRTYQDSRFSLTVMADLGSPKSGYFYQAWIIKEDAYLSLGKMAASKGGYIVEFADANNYFDYTKVAVTEEKILNSSPETTVLEGSF